MNGISNPQLIGKRILIVDFDYDPKIVSRLDYADWKKKSWKRYILDNNFALLEVEIVGESNTAIYGAPIFTFIVKDCKNGYCYTILPMEIIRFIT